MDANNERMKTCITAQSCMSVTKWWMPLHSQNVTEMVLTGGPDCVRGGRHDGQIGLGTLERLET